MGMYILRKILRDNLLSFMHVKSQYGTVVSVVYKQKSNERFTNDFKCGKRHAVNKLEELLGIRRYTALDLVLKNKKLCEVNGMTMKANYDICQKLKVSNEMCIKFPEILVQDNLEERFEMLKKLPHDIHVTAPLVTIKMKDLERMTSMEERRRNLNLRIVTINRILGTDTAQVYEAFVSKVFLICIDLMRLEENAKILTANGVTCEEILHDLWVLKYNPKTIQQRINIVKENNIEKIKTWMIRSKREIFENYVKRRSENKLILGNYTLAEYLSERLDCSVDEAKGLMVKMPALMNKSMKKMDEIIDFLYSQGFRPYHICRVPKILLHSVQTTSKRIRELEKQGMTMDSLHMLTKSQKQYMQFYEALVKSNQQKLLGTK